MAPCLYAACFSSDTRVPKESPIAVYMVAENCRTPADRLRTISQWRHDGGVLIMGYEMYRKLTLGRRKQPGKDGPEADGSSELLEALVRPGPDIVICDEGHRLKNRDAGISQALKAIRTQRRVVLTGYPLQNNLEEYWCMVDFVRPNFLGERRQFTLTAGTISEFNNMFVFPIMNGQCVDSSPAVRP